MREQGIRGNEHLLGKERLKKGIAGEGTGNKREWTLTWQGEAEEEGIAGEGDENAAGVVQEAGLKNPAQWPSAVWGADHAGRLFGAFSGQLFHAGQLSGAGQHVGACSGQLFDASQPSGAGHLFDASQLSGAGQLFGAGQLSRSGQPFDANQLSGACAVQVI